jgi:alpha-L-fucosidase
MHALRNRAEREELNKSRDQARYIEYLHGQVHELLSGYGRIDLLFFDFSYSHREGRKNAKGEPFDGKGREHWDSEKLLETVRHLQPNILVNDRLDLMEQGGWDYKTPEQYQPSGWVEVDGQAVVWEACQTFSGSWGYHRDEETWKSVEQLVQMLIDTVSKGGNLLLNVGPTGRGEFDYRALERLRGIGEWMKRHGRSIYGCTAAPEEFRAPSDCRLTYNPDTRRLYLHLFAWPSGHIHLPGFAGKLEYAQLLDDASEIRWEEHDPKQFIDAVTEGIPEGMLTLKLPIKKPNATVPVIELFLKS